MRLTDESSSIQDDVQKFFPVLVSKIGSTVISYEYDLFHAAVLGERVWFMPGSGNIDRKPVLILQTE